MALVGSLDYDANHIFWRRKRYEMQNFAGAVKHMEQLLPEGLDLAWIWLILLPQCFVRWVFW